MVSLLFSILMGALIGYGTNTLAVEMLFRPFTPKYIWKRRLPFTPGLIPKEQGRIADSLGELIEKELFSPQIVSDALNTPEAKSSIAAWLDRLFDAAAASDRTPRALLIETFGAEEYIRKREDLSALLCSFFVKKPPRPSWANLLPASYRTGWTRRYPFCPAESWRTFM